MNDGCPCKNCDTRYLHCHSECVAYNFWKSEIGQLHDRIMQQKEKEGMLNRVKKCGIDRIKKRRKRT